MKLVRLVKSAVPNISKVAWHSGRRGDKKAGGQLFESNTQSSTQ